MEAQMEKTGKVFKMFAAFLFISHILSANAFSEPALNASVDQTEVSQNESVSLIVEITGPDASKGSVSFEAPDFDPLNQFESQSYRGTWINGKFTNTSSKTVTIVLRPTKLGRLQIKNIKANLPDDVVLTADDLYVRVKAGDTVYPDAGENVSLPSGSTEEKSFFLRAEVNRTKVYRGEPIVVSYYIYRRTRTQVREVIRYPNFDGFSREDLEMPILSGRLNYEAVSVSGTPYERALLARYSISPLKTGKLKVDALSLKIDYVPKSTRMDEFIDDPIFQFFSQVNPRSASRKSDVIEVEAIPLPSGAGDNFSGAIGKFKVQLLEPETEAKVGEPVTLKVKISGTGSLSEVKLPKIKWPDELRVFEARAGASDKQSGYNAESEKVFEIVAIPKVAGQITIPEIKLQFFDPSTRKYVTESTNPFVLNVQASSLSQGQDTMEGESSTATSSENSNDRWKPVPMISNPKDTARSFLGQPWWRWLFWAGLLLLVLTLFYVAVDWYKLKLADRLSRKKKSYDDSSFKDLMNQAKKWTESDVAVDSAAVLDWAVSLDLVVYGWASQVCSVECSGLTRKEVSKILQDNGISAEITELLMGLLLNSEQLRFKKNNQAEVKNMSEVKNIIETLEKLLKFIGSKG